MNIIVLPMTILMHIIFPIGMIVWIKYAKVNYKMDLVFRLFSFLLFLILIYFIGRWENLSIYLRTPLTNLYFVIAFYIVVKKWKTVPSFPLQSKLKYYLVNVLSPLLFLYLCVNIFIGFNYNGEAIELSPPLRKAYVGQGGNAVVLNYHQAYAPQKYALDLTNTNAWGNRANTLLPTKLDDFVIYKDTIFAPCDCKIIKLVDGNEDTPLGGSYTGHPAGNHILFDNNSNIVLMAHIYKNSFLVKEGEFVKKGQAIALVGNSGHSTEPHLHIHSESGLLQDNGNGIPILFNHTFFVRNEIILTE